MEIKEGKTMTRYLRFIWLYIKFVCKHRHLPWYIDLTTNQVMNELRRGNLEDMTIEELNQEKLATQIVIDFLDAPEYPIIKTGNLSERYRIYI